MKWVIGGQVCVLVVWCLYLVRVASAQVPTIVIPPPEQWQGVVCAAYSQRAADCRDANAVRAFLASR